MEKQEQEFKMGPNWSDKFVSPKRINEGWEKTPMGNNTNVITKPDGTVFALHNTKTGMVLTTASIMEVQW